MNDEINHRRAAAIVFAFEDIAPGFERGLAQAVADSDRAAGYVLVKRHGLELFQEEIERAERDGDLIDIPRVKGIATAIKAFLAEIDNPQKEFNL
jgi:hypothetical protein